MGRFKRVCVYCGSNSGNKKIFSDAAPDLGRQLPLFRLQGQPSFVETLLQTRRFSRRLKSLTVESITRWPSLWPCSLGRRSLGCCSSLVARSLVAAFKQHQSQVERKIDLVYGGGSVGLMGLVSQTVYDAGCHVLGIIPRALVPVEISGKSVGEVLTVSSMHERKAEMASRADAFIALPGGYGTMEELLEIIAWSHLGIHGKPVGVLNVDGYYDGLLGLFDKGVEEGFINPSSRNIVVSASTASELLNMLEEYIPQHHQVASTQSWNVEENHNSNS